MSSIRSVRQNNPLTYRHLKIYLHIATVSQDSPCPPEPRQRNLPSPWAQLTTSRKRRSAERCSLAWDAGLATGEASLINVRMPTEYREIYRECAANVAPDLPRPRVVMKSSNQMKTQPLYVICRSGNRPTRAGRKTFPLMQQVQMTAGLLVALGTLMGYFVHPHFVGLPAFVGAGLILAAAAEWCPMTSAIASRPWNQCHIENGGGSCSAW